MTMVNASESYRGARTVEDVATGENSTARRARSFWADYDAGLTFADVMREALAASMDALDELAPDYEDEALAMSDWRLLEIESRNLATDAAIGGAR